MPARTASHFWTCTGENSSPRPVAWPLVFLLPGPVLMRRPTRICTPCSTLLPPAPNSCPLPSLGPLPVHTSHPERDRTRKESPAGPECLLRSVWSGNSQVPQCLRYDPEGGVRAPGGYIHVAPQILCPVGRSEARKRLELSSLKGGTPGRGTHYPVWACNCRQLRGSLASPVFLLPIGVVCAGSNQSCPLKYTECLHSIT